MIYINNHYCYKQLNEEIFDFVMFILTTANSCTQTKQKHCGE